jgi:hypothetical protein
MGCTCWAATVKASYLGLIYTNVLHTVLGQVFVHLQRPRCHHARLDSESRSTQSDDGACILPCCVDPLQPLASTDRHVPSYGKFSPTRNAHKTESCVLTLNNPKLLKLAHLLGNNFVKIAGGDTGRPIVRLLVVRRRSRKAAADIELLIMSKVGQLGKRRPLWLEKLSEACKAEPAT